MTYSESKFRKYLKNELDDPEAYIRKMPDKKQGATLIGLPDYLVVTKGRTIWFEVKISPTKSTFNLNLISESQYIEFNKLHAAGAMIFIAAYINNILYIVPYLGIKCAKFVTLDKSISIDTLNSWRIKW